MKRGRPAPIPLPTSAGRSGRTDGRSCCCNTRWRERVARNAGRATVSPSIEPERRCPAPAGRPPGRKPHRRSTRSGRGRSGSTTRGPSRRAPGGSPTHSHANVACTQPRRGPWAPSRSPPEAGPDPDIRDDGDGDRPRVPARCHRGPVGVCSHAGGDGGWPEIRTPPAPGNGRSAASVIGPPRAPRGRPGRGPAIEGPGEWRGPLARGGVRMRGWHRAGSGGGIGWHGHRHCPGRACRRPSPIRWVAGNRQMR